MHILKDFVTPATMRSLIADVLAAYDPQRNALDLGQSPVVAQLGAQLETIVARPLGFFAAFLFLVADTTLETVSSNPGRGWHVDSACSQVDGDCYNLWLPLYSSAAGTGVEVVAAADNAELYQCLGDPRLPLDILVRAGAPDLFAQLGADARTDLILIRRGSPQALFLSWDDLVLRRMENPRVGDAAVFRQADIHRGFHDAGIRIQLSLKYVDRAARQLEPGVPTAAARGLSKHGRLEAQLVRELLGVQAARLI